MIDTYLTELDQTLTELATLRLSNLMVLVCYTQRHNLETVHTKTSQRTNRLTSELLISEIKKTPRTETDE